MRAPSERTLVEAFPHLDRRDARLIRALAKAVDDVSYGRYGEIVGDDPLEALVMDHLPQTEAYVRKMYSDPYHSHMWRVAVALYGIDEVIEGYGVEGIDGGRFEYINMGDTYATTLIYNRDSNTLFVGTWGDVVERRRL